MCSMSPEAVREEVDYFKTDFNNRIKQVLFNSMLVAYYMGFVPLCFAQVSTLVLNGCFIVAGEEYFREAPDVGAVIFFLIFPPPFFFFQGRDLARSRTLSIIK